jgi:hypothetical protein
MVASVMLSVMAAIVLQVGLDWHAPNRAHRELTEMVATVSVHARMVAHVTQ